MNKTEVCGFTTDDIHDAQDIVGDGGTLEFPSGCYISEGLQARYQNQTWIGESGTIVKRHDTTISAMLQLLANGLKLRSLELDGNRYVNTNLCPGISSTGFSLDMREVNLHSVNHWGLSISDAPLAAIDSQFGKTGQAGIFWRITAAGVSRNGPHIERCNFARGNVDDYTDSGCLIIIGDPSKLVLAPRVINNRMVCCEPGEYASGGVGIFNSFGAIVTGNEVNGGRIGISFGGGDYGTVLGNSVKGCGSYGIEFATNSGDNACIGNLINDCHIGVEVSGTSARNKIAYNPNHGCDIPVHIGNAPVYGNINIGN